MEFKKAFDLMKRGKICSVDDTEYKIKYKYDPVFYRRLKGEGEEDWKEINTLGSFVYVLASDWWEVVE